MHSAGVPTSCGWQAEEPSMHAKCFQWPLAAGSGSLWPVHLQAPTEPVYNKVSIKMQVKYFTVKNKNCFYWCRLNTHTLEWNYLAQVTEDGKHRVETLIGVLIRGFKWDSLAQLSQNDQIQDDRTGQKRILARVVDDERVVSAHQNLGCVLVHGPLAVTCFDKSKLSFYKKFSSN